MARRRRITKVANAARKPRNSPEDALQESIVNWLDVALVAPAMYWATPNGGKRSKKTAALLKKTGTKPGIPDLFVLHNGLLLGPELKAPPPLLKSGALSKAKPRLSDDQKAMHQRLLAAGAKTAVCQSIAEVEIFLREWGVPLRASVLAR